MRELWESIKAYTTYFVMDLALRLFGYDRVVGWVVRRVDRMAPAPDLDDREVTERLRRAIDDIRRLYPSRKSEDCLPRSLAIFYRLCSSGLRAELLIGVKRYPFRAHSWVECDGRVVGESDRVRELFTPLKRIAR